MRKRGTQKGCGKATEAAAGKGSSILKFKLQSHLEAGGTSHRAGRGTGQTPRQVDSVQGPSARSARCLKSLRFTPGAWPSQPRTTTKTGEGKRELSPLSPRLPPTSLFLFSSGKGPDSPVGPTSMDRDQQTQSANVSPQKQCLLAHRPTPHPPSTPPTRLPPHLQNSRRNLIINVQQLGEPPYSQGLSPAPTELRPWPSAGKSVAPTDGTLTVC